MQDSLKKVTKYDDIHLRVIAIGTSTGGPKVLQKVLTSIPEDIPAAFLIVQHMPAKFTKSFAERLDAQCNIKVKEAEDGEIIKPGFAYIAPGGFNLIVKDCKGDLKAELSSSSMGEIHKPSVNIMLNSLVETSIDDLICVIMTGMGADGSKGIVKLKDKKNAFIIAQDEESSVVFGMPKAAIMTGLVDVVLPVDEIAGQILKTLGVNK